MTVKEIYEQTDNSIDASHREEETTTRTTHVHKES